MIDEMFCELTVDNLDEESKNFIRSELDDSNQNAIEELMSKINQIDLAGTKMMDQYDSLMVKRYLIENVSNEQVQDNTKIFKEKYDQILLQKAQLNSQLLARQGLQRRLQLLEIILLFSSGDIEKGRSHVVDGEIVTTKLDKVYKSFFKSLFDEREQILLAEQEFIRLQIGHNSGAYYPSNPQSAFFLEEDKVVPLVHRLCDIKLQLSKVREMGTLFMEEGFETVPLQVGDFVNLDSSAVYNRLFSADQKTSGHVQK